MPTRLLYLADSFLLSNRKRVVEFAANRRLPAMYPYRGHADAGGTLVVCAEQDRPSSPHGCLRGQNPEVRSQPTFPSRGPHNFRTRVIDGKTAKELGLSVPATLLARADEVIE